MTPQELADIADNQIITWGHYKGRSYKDIPAGYFLHFNEQPYCNEYPTTKAYVVQNFEKLKVRHRRETGKIFYSKVVIEPLVPPPPSQTIQLTTREMSDEELALSLSVFATDLNPIEEVTVHSSPPIPSKVKAILQPLKEKVINVLIDDVRAIEL